ncbi:MAG TPA: helix-turn-helix domain-containing protein [Candidatus Nanoarchaeia archaeon]|nr:helix-turn-helix domain-containing protein [Candidatus Nanoarchaeia archaeon]
MKQDQLEKAGLSPNEVKCYLTLLKVGSASANEISRRSGVHRVSVYDALRGLAEKGLVSQITKANKLLFEAGTPERILDMIHEKEERLTEAKNIVPELLLDFKMAKEKQEIHSFKGLAGIKTILKEIIKSETEILDFGAEYKIKEYLPYDYPKWDKERVQKKIKMRIVANIRIKPMTLPLTTIKYVPSEFNSSVSTYIFDGKVALIMWVENPMGILIEHKTVYKSYKNYFEYLWKTAAR